MEADPYRALVSVLDELGFRRKILPSKNMILAHRADENGTCIVLISDKRDLHKKEIKRTVMEALQSGIFGNREMPPPQRSQSFQISLPIQVLTLNLSRLASDQSITSKVRKAFQQADAPTPTLEKALGRSHDLITIATLCCAIILAVVKNAVSLPLQVLIPIAITLYAPLAVYMLHSFNSKIEEVLDRIIVVQDVNEIPLDEERTSYGSLTAVRLAIPGGNPLIARLICHAAKLFIGGHAIAAVERAKAAIRIAMENAGGKGQRILELANELLLFEPKMPPYIRECQEFLLRAISLLKALNVIDQKTAEIPLTMLSLTGVDNGSGINNVESPIDLINDAERLAREGNTEKATDLLKRAIERRISEIASISPEKIHDLLGRTKNTELHPIKVLSTVYEACANGLNEKYLIPVIDATRQALLELERIPEDEIRKVLMTNQETGASS